MKLQRRQAAFSLVLILLVLSAPAEALQKTQAPRIGVVTMVPGPTPRTEAFRKGLAEQGYVDGQNVTIDWKWAAGNPERLPQLVTELLEARADVIVAGGPQPIAVARRLTTTTPIVMVAAADPVRAGLAKTLARPGGNLTGLSIDATPDFLGKQLEIFKEAIPRVSRIAVIWNSVGSGGFEQAFDRLRLAAPGLNVELYWADAQGRDEFESVFARVNSEKVGAALVVSDAFIYAHRARVVALASQHRLPTMYLFEEIVAAGGLMSYGPDLADLYQRAANYVVKILRGAKPGELPVEQPARFHLAINLKTAKDLGLTIPPSLLLRAEQVIE